MNRSYIPFYLNKANNITIYYDYEEKHFFKSQASKQSSFITILSGTAGVILYALFKDTVLNIGIQNPSFIILFSLFISCILAFGTIWGIGYTIEKNKDKIELITTPSKDDLKMYVQEGRKWLISTILLIVFLFAIVLMNVLLLLLFPISGLLFFTNTLLWATFIILVWSVRPLKRREIYKRFNEQLSKNDQELI